MNLWIRSQDKEKLVLATGVELHGSCYDDSCQIFAIWQNNKQFIGVYVSKEKALEVLDEIQKFLENIDSNTIICDKKENLSLLNNNNNKVFEMPAVV